MALRIYTRTGDSGKTSLFGGQRVPKDHLRLEAYGTVDELNAFVGLARTHQPDAQIDAILEAVQNELFSIGADLATPQDEATSRGKVSIDRVSSERTARLETWIDTLEEELPPLTRFILPGGNSLSAALQVARVVCRRAERRCVSLAEDLERTGAPNVNAEVLTYLNRLSDLLFVTARITNHRAGAVEVSWVG